MLDAPVLTPVVEGVTGEPRLEDVSVAGNPALVAKPGGEGPWPTLLLVNGFVPEGRELPEVRWLAKGFARAGYLVVAPDLPGLRKGEIRPDTAAETGVSVVAGVAPYTDIKNLVSLATTGHYRKDGEFTRYATDPFLSNYVVRSLIATLPPGEDRRAFFSELRKVDDWQDQSLLADLCKERLCEVCPCPRSLVELLENDDPRCFDELYARLPEGFRADLERISPVAGDGRLDAPIELLSGSRDKYFPVSESYALARIAPRHRVTVTDALDHVALDPSARKLPAFVSIDGFLVRSLCQARL